MPYKATPKQSRLNKYLSTDRIVNTSMKFNNNMVISHLQVLLLKFTCKFLGRIKQQKTFGYLPGRRAINIMNTTNK